MTGTFAAVPATETSSRPGGRGSAAGRGLPLGPSVTDKGDAPGRWDLLIYSFIIAESGGICEFGESVKGTTATPGSRMYCSATHQTAMYSALLSSPLVGALGQYTLSSGISLISGVVLYLCWYWPYWL